MKDSQTLLAVRSIVAAAALLLFASPLPAQTLVKLVPPGALSGDAVGNSVALSGDTAIVGVPNDDTTAGVNAGSAAVYVRSGGAWTLQATLLDSTPAAQRSFGRAAACSGDTAAVAEFGDDYAAGSQGGSVHVFERSGTPWSEEAVLSSSPSKPFDGFGWAIALQGDTLVLTSMSANASKGAAFVYVHSGSSWLLQAELVGDDSLFLEDFGWSVALSGNTVVVGAPQEETGGLYSGAAYVFVRNGSSWTQQAKLKAADPGTNDDFGGSVAVSGDTIIVGEDEDQIGTETQAGSAYVFVRSGTTWSQQAKLISSDATHADMLGSSVAVEGDLAVLAAKGDDDSGLNDGSAYLFFRVGSVWFQHGKLHGLGTGSSAFFGTCVSLSGDNVILGAPGDNGAVPASQVGAAYLYGLSVVPWTDLGFGLAGVEGIPRLVGGGSLVAGTSGSLTLSLAKPSTPSMLFASLVDAPTSFKGGALHTVPPIAQVLLATSTGGGWTLPWASWPAGIPVGLAIYLQVAVSDPAALQGVSLSNVLQAVQP